MKFAEQLCRVFCDGISVEEVDAGFAVATAFEDSVGDRIGFYLIRDTGTGLWRIEDDGSVVPSLIAMGTNVTQGQRARLFGSILASAGVEYDEEAGELKTPLLTEDAIPMAAMRFVSMMVRVAALSAMRPEMVTNTFREDAIARIKADLGSRFPLREREPISDALAEFEPDVILRPARVPPVAVFIAVSDARLYEAIFLRMVADHEARQPCSVVALMDRIRSRLITNKMLQRAENRLDATPVFYGEEAAAIERIAKEALVPRAIN